MATVVKLTRKKQEQKRDDTIANAIIKLLDGKEEELQKAKEGQQASRSQAVQNKLSGLTKEGPKKKKKTPSFTPAIRF